MNLVSVRNFSVQILCLWEYNVTFQEMVSYKLSEFISRHDLQPLMKAFEMDSSLSQYSDSQLLKRYREGDESART